jgi:hypothetical protein
MSGEHRAQQRHDVAPAKPESFVPLGWRPLKGGSDQPIHRNFPVPPAQCRLLPASTVRVNQRWRTGGLG